MASGVEVDEDCVREFNNVKLGKAYKYIIYTMSDDKRKIIVGKKADKGVPYTELYDELVVAEEKGKCCYALVDMEVTTKSGAKTDKLALISWCPDSASIKEKMLYTSSVEHFKKKLGTGFTHYQANDVHSLEEGEIREKLERGN